MNEYVDHMMARGGSCDDSRVESYGGYNVIITQHTGTCLECAAEPSDQMIRCAYCAVTAKRDASGKCNCCGATLPR